MKFFLFKMYAIYIVLNKGLLSVWKENCCKKNKMNNALRYRQYHIIQHKIQYAPIAYNVLYWKQPMQFSFSAKLICLIFLFSHISCLLLLRSNSVVFMFHMHSKSMLHAVAFNLWWKYFSLCLFSLFFCNILSICSDVPTVLSIWNIHAWHTTCQLIGSRHDINWMEPLFLFFGHISLLATFSIHFFFCNHHHSCRRCLFCTHIASVLNSPNSFDFQRATIQFTILINREVSISTC